ncbi:MAG: hypothetical protein ACK5LC_10245 [Coprobacillaceae bacterium]
MKSTKVLNKEEWQLFKGNDNIERVKKYEQDKINFLKRGAKNFSIIFGIFFAVPVVISLFIGIDEMGMQMVGVLAVFCLVVIGVYNLFNNNKIKNVKLDAIGDKELYYQVVKLKQKKMTRISGVNIMTFILEFESGKKVKLSVDSYTYNLITKVGAIAITANPDSELIHYLLPMEDINPTTLEVEELKYASGL